MATELLVSSHSNQKEEMASTNGTELAKKVCAQLEDCDNISKNVLNSAQDLHKKLSLMKEYEEHAKAINNQTNANTRDSIIDSIQREHYQISRLEQENQELKCSLEDHQMALDLIMSKYRAQVSQLLELNKKETVSSHGASHISTTTSAEVDEKAEKIVEMATVMKKAINIDDTNHNNFMELLTRLQAENQCLRELLNISNETKLLSSDRQPKDNNQASSRSIDLLGVKPLLMENESNQDLTEEQTSE